MPRLADRTVADQIHELLAPVQPDDCRKANLAILANALAVTGPVVHQGVVVSAKSEDDEHTVDFDNSRPVTKPAPTTRVDEDGTVHEIEPPEPTDAELAKQWGLPEARALPLPQPASNDIK